METDNLIYKKLKDDGTVKGQKLDFLNFLCLFGPCSANELIAEVQKKNLLSSLEANKLNRHPSVLKDLGVIKVHSIRKCKVSSSNKPVEVLEVVSELPLVTKKATGKSLKILENSKNAALLAVEVYNKPRTTFRTESYISLMINAWTKLLHAYFRMHQGEIYFYPKKSGENLKRTWDLSKCLKEPLTLSEPVHANLELFIGLRNEVEHGIVDEKIIDTNFFGECQALLFNYENFLTTHFGEVHALNETLAFSLQFSIMRDPSQQQSNRKMLSVEAREILSYLDKYRTSLTNSIFDSQEFSIKLLQVPRISNSSRSDLAISFIKYDELSEEDKESYKTLTGLVKKQIEKIAVANAGKFKPGQALKKINKEISLTLNSYDLNCLYRIFQVKPTGKNKNSFSEKVNSKFCVFDQPNENYLFTEDWIEFVIKLIKKYKFNQDKIRDLDKKKETLSFSSYV